MGPGKPGRPKGSVKQPKLCDKHAPGQMTLSGKLVTLALHAAELPVPGGLPLEVLEGHA